MRRPDMTNTKLEQLVSSAGGRALCGACGRPAVACWCSYVRRIETRHRVLVLQHPREAHYKFGSVNVLRRTLPEVAVRVGIDFASDAEVHALVHDQHRPGVLLYPRTQGPTIDAQALEGQLTLVVIDGTWSQARAILRANVWTSLLPHLSLTPSERSRYVVRRQPCARGLCTLEAVAEALFLTEGNADVRNAVMAPLRALMGMHLACFEAGSADVLNDRRRLEQAGYLPPPHLLG